MVEHLRVASFNASMNRGSEGQLVSDPAGGTDDRAEPITEIVQKTEADIIQIGEFNFDDQGDAATLFRDL